MTNASDSSLENEQSEVLQAAYEAGYFERPRRIPGTDVAEALGLSPATFQHRLQEALAVCVEQCLAERDGADS